jgi:1-acyl-sn-glycerol-3-phosphate acyltransferase
MLEVNKKGFRCAERINEVTKMITLEKIKVLTDDVKEGTSHSLNYLLSEKVENTLSLKGIKIRKIFAPLMRFIYGFQSDYQFIIDKREPLSKTSKGRIFIVNHRQGDDMVFSAKAVGKSAYFVFGNPILACESLMNGFGLWSYGMILLKREEKSSRQAAMEKMKFLLVNGANVIIFPEGYWNLADNGLKDENHGADDHNSENWLIQDINIGVLRLARELGCEIVPTILHYDENNMRCYARRGNSFTVLKTDNIFQKKDELLEIMYTMYYELMEKYSFYTRKELEENNLSLKEQWELLKKKLISSCDIDKVNYKLDLEDEKRIGKAKVINPVTANEEAFEHLGHIEYTKENAFLLSKNNTGRRK